MKPSKEPKAPRVGQIYRENDPRFTRYVEVLWVGATFCLIRNTETNRQTRARTDRFNSTARGKYSFYKERA